MLGTVPDSMQSLPMATEQTAPILPANTCYGMTGCPGSREGFTVLLDGSSLMTSPEAAMTTLSAMASILDSDRTPTLVIVPNCRARQWMADYAPRVVLAA